MCSDPVIIAQSCTPLADVRDVHWLPFGISLDGPANVSEYFVPQAQPNPAGNLLFMPAELLCSSRQGCSPRYAIVLTVVLIWLACSGGGGIHLKSTFRGRRLKGGVVYAPLGCALIMLCSGLHLTTVGQ
jgi:hypothetical protein